MEGPKRYFPTTGKTDAYGNPEILHLDALSAGFDENNKPIPYIVIADLYDKQEIRIDKAPIVIYSSVDFANEFQLKVPVQKSFIPIKYKIENKKIDRNIMLQPVNQIFNIDSSDSITGKNIDFKTIEIIRVLISKENSEYSYPFNDNSKIYFVGWYHLNGPNGKAVLYDEVEATQIMENCINCNSSYKFIERSKEHNTFCSKDCQVEHYRLN